MLCPPREDDRCGGALLVPQGQTLQPQVSLHSPGHLGSPVNGPGSTQSCRHLPGHFGVHEALLQGVCQPLVHQRVADKCSSFPQRCSELEKDDMGMQSC